MEDIKTEDGWHKTADGMKLYTRTWKTPSPPKALLVFIHGFSDHCNAYGPLFPTLASRGIQVHAFDQRGWGLSVHTPREQGLTGPTAQVLDDITSFIKTLLPTSIPLFLMGHSMGGAEVLCYTAQGPKEVRECIRGYLLEAPFIALHPSSRPYGITVALGRLAGKLMPKHQLLNVIDAKLLSRDPAVQQEFIEDKLCHDTGTLEGLAGMLDRAAALESGKVKVPIDAGEGGKTRIWLSHGTEDGVCEYKATAELFKRLERVEDKELKLYNGWFHKLHAEPGTDREMYANDVAEWILARSASDVK
ncbi:alpha/beta-hydrolase [Tothia fuscella]|uniref:Alpha/beta-hydrolase n=1 Tax=Tothia fuscella TaxID=1048955 RepID=A0A9P4NMF6_9PEZI|nr:alpha/beta-hydrolase [Tothia fuscella]